MTDATSLDVSMKENTSAPVGNEDVICQGADNAQPACKVDVKIVDTDMIDEEEDDEKIGKHGCLAVAQEAEKGSTQNTMDWDSSGHESTAATSQSNGSVETAREHSNCIDPTEQFLESTREEALTFADPLREKVAESEKLNELLRTELRESQEANACARKDILDEMRTKTKDHIKSLQEKLQQPLLEKDMQIKELEIQVSELKSRHQNDAEADQEFQCSRQRLESAKAMSDTLLVELKEREQQLAQAQEEVSRVHQDTETKIADVSSTQRLENAEAMSDTLRVELQEREQQLAQAQEEVSRVRQDTETKIADVVRRAKEHVKQVQSRLQASDAEKQELFEKHKQDQDKVMKYKQLMGCANTRIQESDDNVRHLREVLNMYTVPPSAKDILEHGGIQLAVEDDCEDVWCLISGMSNETVTEQQEGENTFTRVRQKCWWPLSKLDVDESPIPLQRRFKGEISALCGQLSQQKRHGDELEERFEDYRQRASAALKTGASNSEESLLWERKMEDLGTQLQTLTLDFQHAELETLSAREEIGDARKQLQDALSQKLEVERVLDLRVREGEESRQPAIEACKRLFETEKNAAEQEWCKREREYQHKLDLDGAHTQFLKQEIDDLRSRLANRLASPTPDVDTTEHGSGESCFTSAEAVAASLEEADSLKQEQDKHIVESQYHLPESDTQTMSSLWHAPDPVSKGPMSQSSNPLGLRERGVATELPLKSYSLHASVAWQDLAHQRSQVRQLEISLHEEKHKHSLALRENELLKTEIQEIVSQQRLQNTVGQHQQMEYIRNVFRKFVESMPIGNAEHEQLVPVLMTFFQFPAVEAKAIQSKRQEKAQGFWKWRAN